MRQITLGYILRKKARYYPEKPAIVDGDSGREYTYRELEQRSNAIAHSLSERGVDAGSRVCLVARNVPEYFDLLFATAKLGAVLAPVNYRLAPAEVETLVADADPEVFVYEADFEELLAKVDVGDRPTYRIPPVDRDETADWKGDEPADEPYETLLDGPGGRTSIVPAASDPAVLLYTSGSTGRPKGVPVTHRNLFFSSVNWIVDMGITYEDISFSPAPLFHAGALCGLTIQTVHVGGTLLLSRDFDPVESWDLLESHGVTKCFLIPTMLNAMLAVDDWQESTDLDALELVIAGGEPIPTETKEALASVDIPLVPGYGLTETTDGTLFLRPERTIEHEATCMGSTFTHTDVSIVDDGGTEVSPGERGEIRHRGPQVVDGYWNRPDATAETFDDKGWMYTGDVGERDEDGFVHVLGRVDNMIITGGENVYPSEVEEHLYDHPDIAEAVVFGVSDDEWGQAVTAAVVPSDDADLTRESIETFLDGRLAGYKQPKAIKIVASLPKTGSGKIDRQDVLEQFS